MPFGTGISHKTPHAPQPRAKGQKTVFANRQVAHVWAAQGQGFGRSSNGNLYFEGASLFSYGSHFIVGYRTGNVALLNADSHSITTSHHKSLAWAAVRHLTVYNVPGLTDFIRSGCLGDKARTQAHITKHAFEPEAAVYLLRRAGVADAPRMFARLQRDAARKAAKAKAKEAADLKAVRLAHAKRAAAYAESDFATWLQGATRHNLETAALDLHHAQRAANAAGRNAQGRACGAFLKRVRGRLAFLKARAERVERNKYTRTQVRALRDAIKRHAAGVDDQYALYFYDTTLAGSAGWIARHATALGGLKRDVFETIEREARAIAAPIRADFEAAEKARREREAAERFEREAAKRAAWLAGAPGHWHGSDERGGALLRAVNIGRDADGTIVSGELQTSWGANVPLAHAVRAFRFLKLCHDTGRAFESNGRTIHVGHFKIDRVESSGDFKAGCHTFHWPEIERIARALGVFEVTPDDSAVVASH